MADDWIFRLECGDRGVNLLKTDAGGWGIAESGVTISSPPANVTYSGNSRYSGARRMGTTYQDTKITLTTHLTKQSGLGALQKNIHDVMQFIVETQLYQEGKSRQPVYLVRRLAEGYSGTGNNVVLFGRGNIYHEVKMIDSIEIPDSSYSKFLRNSTATIQGVKFTLTVSPFGYSKTCFAGEASGWVRFDNDGALEIYAAGSNFFTNGGFEHSTYDTSWGVTSASLVKSKETERTYSGFHAMRLVNQSNVTGRSVYKSASTDNGAGYMISCYCYKDGTAITSSDCDLLANGNPITTTYTSAEKLGWYRLSGSFTGNGSSATHGLRVLNQKSVIVDGFQLESQLYPTPLMLENSVIGIGAAYDGTAHNSQTTRTGGQYRIRVKNANQSSMETLFFSKGAISCWVKTPWVPSLLETRMIFDTYDVADGSNINRLLLYATGTTLRFSMWGSITDGEKDLDKTINDTTWSANTWHHVLVTWDETGPTAMYLDGVISTTVASSGIWAPLSDIGPYLYIGSATVVTSQLNGQIADFRIFGPDATITAADLYAAGRGKTMLPFVWLSTIDIPTNSTGFYVGNIPGDFPARCRLYLANTKASAPVYTGEQIYLGMKTVKSLPFVLDTVYGASSFSASTGTITGSIHLDSSYRDREYFGGKYIVSAYGNTNASAGNYQLRATVDGDVGDYKVFSSGSFTSCNLGTFSVPAMEPIQPFFGTERQETAEVPISIDVNNVGGDSTVLVMTTVKMIAENGGYLKTGTLLGDYALVLDSVSPQKKAYKVTWSGSAPKTDAVAVDWANNIPTLEPHQWIYFNEYDVNTTTGLAALGQIYVYLVYMAQWGWGS